MEYSENIPIPKWNIYIYIYIYLFIYLIIGQTCAEAAPTPPFTTMVVAGKRKMQLWTPTWWVTKKSCKIRWGCLLQLSYFDWPIAKKKP
jgi:hypothetical protein